MVVVGYLSGTDTEGPDIFGTSNLILDCQLSCRLLQEGLEGVRIWIRRVDWIMLLQMRFECTREITCAILTEKSGIEKFREAKILLWSKRSIYGKADSLPIRSRGVDRGQHYLTLQYDEPDSGGLLRAGSLIVVQ